MPPRIPLKKKKKIIEMSIKGVPKYRIAQLEKVSRKSVYNILEDFNTQFEIKQYKRNILDPLAKKINELIDIEHDSFMRMYAIKERCGYGYEGSKECENSPEYKAVLEEYEIDEQNKDKAQRIYDRARERYDKLRESADIEKKRRRSHVRHEKWMKKHEASEKNYQKLIASETKEGLWTANIHYDEKRHKWVRDYKKRDKSIKDKREYKSVIRKTKRGK